MNNKTSVHKKSTTRFPQWIYLRGQKERRKTDGGKQTQAHDLNLSSIIGCKFSWDGAI